MLALVGCLVSWAGWLLGWLATFIAGLMAVSWAYKARFNNILRKNLHKPPPNLAKYL